MEISHKEITPGTIVIALAGKLVLGQHSEQITDLVGELLRQGKRRIVFDVAGVTRIDSTGIGRFISSYNQIASARGDMRIAAAPGHVFGAFHVSRLDTVFRFYPTVEAAQES